MARGRDSSSSSSFSSFGVGVMVRGLRGESAENGVAVIGWFRGEEVGGFGERVVVGSVDDWDRGKEKKEEGQRRLVEREGR